VVQNRSLWGELKKLPAAAQFELAGLLALYDWLREAVANGLVAPALDVAPGSDVQREEMVDAAMLGLLSCATVPEDGRGVLSTLPPDALPEILGMWLLSDSSDRGVEGAVTLEQAGYSAHVDEAFSQVLNAWARISGISDTRVEDVARSARLHNEWKQFAGAALGGGLLGVGRQGVETVIALSQRLVSEMSPRRAAIVGEMVERFRGSASSRAAEESGETLSARTEAEESATDAVRVKVVKVRPPRLWGKPYAIGVDAERRILKFTPIDAAELYEAARSAASQGYLVIYGVPRGHIIAELGDAPADWEDHIEDLRY
jgi:hypothetical protein